ncbi:MAG: N-6 DNA methylase [Deltaproteobacteria bacterium]|nr:N-6 DNA methylase [Deltaproteobacteria bacterium]
MPPLFQQKVLQAAIERFDMAQIPNLAQKREILAKWKQTIDSNKLKGAGEVSIHGVFLSDLFATVLGYKQITEHPTEWNLVHEQKTQFDATRPDGSLGFFTKDLTDTRGVIELKSTDTDLDAKQHRKHDKRSPVEQAFSYVPKSGKKCNWIIVSNYVELRFYHKNSLGEYVTFRIADLTDEVEFKRFYYLLSIENLIAKDGESIIGALYRRSEEEEKNISKKFYAEYTQARLHLFEHLKHKNSGNAPVLSVAEGGVSPKISLPSTGSGHRLGGVRGGFPTLPGHDLFLLEKTQKLLDRFIFVCFCEDTGMLPAKIFRKVVKHAQESFAFTEDKIWTELKGLFRAIDQGSPAHRIHGFDGELFKPDPALDALHIGDDIFHELANITDYDFDSDLNVNILGHIFEQSISDLEELRAGIEGKEIDRKKGKRKKEGIFYTPEYITRYIVENAVGGWLEDRKQELGLNDLPELTEEDYASVKVIKSVYKGNKKIELHRVFWEAYKEKLMNIKVLDPAGGSGAFLNQAFDFLHKKGQRVNDALAALSHGQKTIFDLDRHILSNNLYGVDLNRESVEITKLSLWLKTANKHSRLTALDDNIKCGNSLIDEPLVAGEKAFKWEGEFPEIMRNGGFDVVIGNPPYGATINKYELPFLLSKYRGGLSRVFADSYAIFMLLGLKVLLKEHGNLGFIIPNTWLYVGSGKEYRDTLLHNFQFLRVVQYKEKVFEDATVDCVTVIIKNSKQEHYDIQVSTVNHLEIIHESISTPSILKNQEYFNFNISQREFELIDRIRSQSLLVGEYFGIKNGIKPYEVGKGTPPQTREIVKEKPYTSDKKENDSFMPLIGGSLFHRYALYWDHDYWISYGEWLAAPRDPKIFQAEEKLIFRQTSDSIIGTFITNPFIMRNNTHIVLKKDDRFDLKYLLCLLNSKLMGFIYWSINPEKGETLAEVKAFHLEKLVFKDIPLDQQQPFIEKTDKMLELTKQFYEDTKKFIRFIESSYNPKKLSTKLNTFYTFSFSDFVKELKKQKVPLSKQNEFELMDLFEAQKAKALSLQQEINDTDKEIGTMVYELYGLTEEEIRIVEGN